MTKEIVLEAKSISLTYRINTGFLKNKKYQVFHNLNLELYKGEMLGVSGSNGAGKSTLLKLLCGVIEPDAGSIHVKDGYSRSLLALGVGFNNSLSGRDNVILSSIINGMTKKEALNILENVKEFSELEDFFEYPINTYSSGMRSRLGFAASLYTKVDILCIDEILSVGDAKFRQKAKRAMLNFIRDGKTVVFVSHDQNQINTLCDREINISKLKGMK